MLIAAPAFALPKPPVIAVAGDDPAFGDSGLVFFSPIDGRGYNIDATLATLYDGNILRIGNGQTPRPGRPGIRCPRDTHSVGQHRSADRSAATVRRRTDRWRRLWRQHPAQPHPHMAWAAGINLSAGSRCTGTIAANYTSRQVLVSEESEAIPNARGHAVLWPYRRLPVSGRFGGGGRRAADQHHQFGAWAARRSMLEFAADQPVHQLWPPDAGPVLADGQSELREISQPLHPRHRLAMCKTDGTNIFSGRLGYQRGARQRLQISARHILSADQPAALRHPCRRRRSGHSLPARAVEVLGHGL